MISSFDTLQVVQTAAALLATTSSPGIMNDRPASQCVQCAAVSRTAAGRGGEGDGVLAAATVYLSTRPGGG
jgi:hypothetical protein